MTEYAPETASSRSLRDRHKDYTRELIMEALTEILSEGGVHSFTVQEVADRAGVSHRTVYRHFPTREALLTELAGWLDEQLRRRGAPSVPKSLDEMFGSLEIIYPLFDEYESLVRALSVVYAVTSVRPEAREQRTQALERLLEESLPDGTAEERRMLFLVGRTLASSQAWLFLHDHLGASGEEAGRAAQWALRTLFDSLRKRTSAREADATTE